MKIQIFHKLEYSILFRKYLINLLLLFFSPKTKFMIALSQNLDKFIVLYQKKLLSKYNHKHANSKSFSDIVV
jgi:hypothetical protein